MIDSLTPLTSLGLSDTDLNVYAFLLKNGETGAPKIKDGLNLHPQLVYRSLEHLEEKGLISAFSRGTWKHYRAAPLSEVEEMVADFKRSIDRSLEVMNRLLKEEKSQDFIRVFFGIESFIKARIEHIKIIPNNTTFDIFHSKKEFYQVVGEDWLTITRLQKQKNITYRLLSFLDLKDLEIKNLGEEVVKEQVRFLPEDFNSPISVALGGQRALMAIWGQEMISLVIDSPVFVNTFQVYFESLWLKAKTLDEVQAN